MLKTQQSNPYRQNKLLHSHTTYLNGPIIYDKLYVNYTELMNKLIEEVILEQTYLYGITEYQLPLKDPSVVSEGMFTVLNGKRYNIENDSVDDTLRDKLFLEFSLNDLNLLERWVKDNKFIHTYNINKYLLLSDFVLRLLFKTESFMKQMKEQYVCKHIEFVIDDRTYNFSNVVERMHKDRPFVCDELETDYAKYKGFMANMNDLDSFENVYRKYVRGGVLNGEVYGVYGVEGYAEDYDVDHHDNDDNDDYEAELQEIELPTTDTTDAPFYMNVRTKLLSANHEHDLRCSIISKISLLKHYAPPHIVQELSAVEEHYGYHKRTYTLIPSQDYSQDHDFNDLDYECYDTNAPPDEDSLSIHSNISHLTELPINREDYKKMSVLVARSCAFRQSNLDAIDVKQCSNTVFYILTKCTKYQSLTITTKRFKYNDATKERKNDRYLLRHLLSDRREQLLNTHSEERMPNVCCIGFDYNFMSEGVFVGHIDVKNKGLRNHSSSTLFEHNSLENKYVSTFYPPMHIRSYFVDELCKEFDNLSEQLNVIFEERDVQKYGLETLFSYVHRRYGLVIDTNDSVGINAFVNMQGLLSDCVIQDVNVKFNRRLDNIALSFISEEYAKTWLRDIVEQYKSVSKFENRVVNALRD